MFTKVFESHIKAPVQKVWDFHSNAQALKLLTPPEQHIKLISKNTEVKLGALHVVETQIPLRKIQWRARITKVNEPKCFVDVAEKSPFKYWEHVHEFIEVEGETILRDTITYEPPGWIFKGIVNTIFVSDKLDDMFKYRHKTTKQLLESEAAHINDELFAVVDSPETSQLIN